MFHVHLCITQFQVYMQSCFCVLLNRAFFRALLNTVARYRSIVNCKCAIFAQTLNNTYPKRIIFTLRKLLVFFVHFVHRYTFIDMLCDPSRVPWTDGGMNAENEEHETYLNKFKNSIFHKLKSMVLKSLEEEPELKSRKKIVEVITFFYTYVCA